MADDLFYCATLPYKKWIGYLYTNFYKDVDIYINLIKYVA